MSESASSDSSEYAINFNMKCHKSGAISILFDIGNFLHINTKYCLRLIINKSRSFFPIKNLPLRISVFSPQNLANLVDLGIPPYIKSHISDT